jgi:hypothetical protein
VSRPKFDIEWRDWGIESLKCELARRLKQHGDGIFVSEHEVMGVVAEEYHEVLQALHDNDLNDFINELLDLSVGAMFGAMSLMQLSCEKDTVLLGNNNTLEA